MSDAPQKNKEKSISALAEMAIAGVIIIACAFGIIESVTALVIASLLAAMVYGVARNSTPTLAFFVLVGIAVAIWSVQNQYWGVLLLLYIIGLCMSFCTDKIMTTGYISLGCAILFMSLRDVAEGFPFVLVTFVLHHINNGNKLLSKYSSGSPEANFIVVTTLYMGFSLLFYFLE